jgi:hypothetical protein
MLNTSKWEIDKPETRSFWEDDSARAAEAYFRKRQELYAALLAVQHSLVWFLIRWYDESFSGPVKDIDGNHTGIFTGTKWSEQRKYMQHELVGEKLLALAGVIPEDGDDAARVKWSEFLGSSKQ